MKTLLAAVLLTSLAGTSAAFSADLPVIVPDVEMVDTSSDWSGLFIGAHVGYASGVVEWATLPTGLFTGDYGIAGWLASLIVRGGGMGLAGNVVLGIVGAVVAGWLFPLLGLGFGGGMVGAILAAMIGAIIVLLIISLVKRA